MSSIVVQRRIIDLMVFSVDGLDGESTHIVQHVSHVNVTFQVVKVTDSKPVPKIGFQTPKDPTVKEREADQGDEDDDDDVEYQE